MAVRNGLLVGVVTRASTKPNPVIGLAFARKNPKDVATIALVLCLRDLFHRDTWAYGSSS